MNLRPTISMRASRGGATFDPSTLSGGLFRLRPDSGVVLDGSNRVQSWTDSWNGHVFSQATAGNRPLYTASGVNSKPTVDFAVARVDYLAGPTIDCSAFTGLTLIAILNFTNTGTYSMIVAHNGKDELRSQGSNAQMASAGVDNCAGVTSRAGSWGVMSGTHVAAGSTTRVYWNNTEDANAPAGAGALGSADFAIGSRGAGSLTMNASLAEVLAYSRALSTIELAQVVTYAARYGI